VDRPDSWHGSGTPDLCARAHICRRGIEKVIREIEKLEGKDHSVRDGRAVIKVVISACSRNWGKDTRAAGNRLCFRQQGTTVVKELWQRRKDRRTPYAVFEPVKIGNGSLDAHNWDEIRRKDIRFGDTVVIERAGDVIPHVISVDLNRRPKERKKSSFPKVPSLRLKDGP
jgi:DNA ligase (NAD+)